MTTKRTYVWISQSVEEITVDGYSKTSGGELLERGRNAHLHTTPPGFQCYIVSSTAEISTTSRRGGGGNGGKF